MSQREKRTPKNDSDKGSRLDFKRKKIEKATAKKLRKNAKQSKVKQKKRSVKRKNGRKPSAQLVTKLRTEKLLGVVSEIDFLNI